MADSIVFPPLNLWPVGFGFRPTEEELITHYLKNKMIGKESLVRFIPEVDLYNYEPWDLPELSILESGNHEWFYFRSQPSNGRPRRTTRTGYWKSTGEDRKIIARGTNQVIGTRKILVFHKGKSPKGVKTPWIIHEYHLHLDTSIAYQGCFVVCRLKENAEDKRLSTPDGQLKCSVAERAFQDESGNGLSVVNRPTLPPPQAGEVNGVQLEATESEFSVSDLLNLVGDENIDDGASMICLDDFNEPVSTLTNRLHDGGPESDLHLTEFLNSVFDDDKINEVTSMIRVNGFNEDMLELDYMDYDGPYDWQNNDISSTWYQEYGSSSGAQSQNTPIMKASRRSPLTVKRIQYNGEQGSHDYELQADSGEGVDSKVNVSSYHGGTKTIKTGHGRQSQQIVAYESSPKSVQSKREKEKHSTVILQNKDKGNMFSKILVTKTIHHKSREPIVYLAKAFLGIMMLVMFAEQVLLHGNWGLQAAAPDCCTDEFLMPFFQRGEIWP